MCCTVETCCCGTDLRRGTLAVAVFSMLGNLSVLVSSSWLTIQVCTFLKLVEQAVNEADEPLEVNTENIKKSLRLLVTFLVVSVVAILMDVVLYVGVLRSLSKFLQWWLRVHAFIFGLYFLMVWFLVSLIADTERDLILAAWLAPVVTVLGIVVMVYMRIVVNSYAVKLRQQHFSQTVKYLWFVFQLE